MPQHAGARRDRVFTIDARLHGLLEGLTRIDGGGVRQVGRWVSER